MTQFIRSVNKRHERQVIAGVLALVVCCSLSACSKSGEDSAAAEVSDAKSQALETTSMTVAPAQRQSEIDSLLTESVDYSSAGKFRECMEASTRAAELDSSSSRAFNNVGFCAGKLGLWDEAIENLEKAVQIDPGNEHAKNNLAWAQQKAE